MHSRAVKAPDSITPTPIRIAAESGDRLIIRLEKPNPDLVFRVALPFFCPIPVDLPHDPAAVDDVPASGPYYVAVHRPDDREEPWSAHRFRRATQRLHAGRAARTVTSQELPTAE